MGSHCESEIAKWYQDKAVFITGATGFMGKVLIEKLIRSCPEGGPIYLLIREKKKISPQERVEKMLKSCLFDELHISEEKLRKRVVAIPGDAGQPGLGISSEDKRLLQDTVSVVFHLAATVKFDEPLPVAVAMNIDSTRALLEICRGMTNLCAIVHVSTAYANCTRQVIEERVYPPPADPNVVNNCVSGLNDELLQLVTPRLIGDYPNTYTFTKALAEQVVAGYSAELPVVIVRPSIVVASWREPIPGWVDNLNGPTGLLASSGSGLFKCLYGKGQLIVDLIPVDVCSNLFIAAAWEIGTRESAKLVPSVRVYNCVSQPFKSVTWNECALTVDICSRKYAMSNVFTIPRMAMSESRVKIALSDLLERTLPAILADTYIRITGGKPRFRSYLGKLNKAAASFWFFTTHEYKFTAENVEELKGRLNPADRVIFNFDITDIDWEEFVTRYFIGIRKYVMKEKDDTISASRQRVNRWILLKKVLQAGVLIVVSIVTYYQIYPTISFWSKFHKSE